MKQHIINPKHCQDIESPDWSQAYSNSRLPHSKGSHEEAVERLSPNSKEAMSSRSILLHAKIPYFLLHINFWLPKVLFGFITYRTSQLVPFQIHPSEEGNGHNNSEQGKSPCFDPDAVSDLLSRWSAGLPAGKAYSSALAFLVILYLLLGNQF